MGRLGLGVQISASFALRILLQSAGSYFRGFSLGGTLQGNIFTYAGIT